MVPVIKKLMQEPRIESFVCVTARHRTMRDQMLDLTQINPDVDLNINDGKSEPDGGWGCDLVWVSSLSLRNTSLTWFWTRAIQPPPSSLP